MDDTLWLDFYHKLDGTPVHELERALEQFEKNLLNSGSGYTSPYLVIYPNGQTRIIVHSLGYPVILARSGNVYTALNKLETLAKMYEGKVTAD